DRKVPLVVRHTSENRDTSPFTYPPNSNLAPEPRMPWISHYRNIGFMGVEFPSCTIVPAHIPVLDQEHRMRVCRRQSSKRSATVFKKIAGSLRNPFLVGCIMNTGWRKSRHDGSIQNGVCIFCGPQGFSTLDVAGSIPISRSLIQGLSAALISAVSDNFQI